MENLNGNFGFISQKLRLNRTGAIGCVLLIIFLSDMFAIDDAASDVSVCFADEVETSDQIFRN